MALSTSLPTNYTEEPTIFVSSTTINLKPSTVLPLRQPTDFSKNVTFEWHTNVATPPNTPVSPIVKEHVRSQNQSSTQQSAPARTRDLFLPAFSFEESDDLNTKLDKFMSCERYHSHYHQVAQRSTNL